MNHFFLKIILCFFLFSIAVSYAEKPVSKEGKPCTTTCNLECSQKESSTPSWTRNGVLVLVIVGGGIYLYVNQKRKIYLVLSTSLVLLIVGTTIYANLKNQSKPQKVCVLPQNNPKESVSVTDEFLPAGDEFSQADSSIQSPESGFKSGEFTEETSDFASSETVTKTQTKPENALLYQLLVLFGLLILIRFGIKYSAFRKTRGLFLLASVVYLGFVRGACPCMIMSFQNAILWIYGTPTTWIAVLWFLGLLPLTYFFGKIWCGWLCHLGGLQEFLFQSHKLKILTTPKSQKIIKYVQISTFVVLMVQLFVTRTNIFVHYDPFKVAFNLISANTTGYVLLVILLVSSVLIYRPFCRAFCPVGLILGWISFIPKAKKLVKNDSCVHCKNCSNACKQNAITHHNQTAVLRAEDCIVCGECLGTCKKNSLLI